MIFLFLLKSTQNKNIMSLSWIINFVTLWVNNFSLNLSKWKFCENVTWMCFGFFFLYLNSKLTKVLKTYVDNAEKCGITDQLFKAMKALEYIFKFIVRSRILFNQWVQAVLKPPIANNAQKLPTFPRASVKIAQYCTVLEILEAVRGYFRRRFSPLQQRCVFSVAANW